MYYLPDGVELINIMLNGQSAEYSITENDNIDVIYSRPGSIITALVK